MHPTDKAARVAGAVYLSMVFTAPFTLLYLPGKVIVRGNAPATADNILAHETLFRLGIVAELAGAVIFVVLVTALYRLLSSVNKNHALLMVVLVVVSATVAFMNTLNNIAALTLVRATDFLAVIAKPQRDALAMLFLRLHAQGNVMNEMLWGLWLFPFGILVMRSRFLPRFLGVLLIINGLTYVVVSVSSLLVPGSMSALNQFAIIFETGELWMMLWLLIKGAKVNSLEVAA